MEDSEIIELYWNRNESAIDETDKKYGRYIFIIVNQILSNLEDSKECVNDTYLRTWNSIPPTRPNVFKLFLAKISRNLAFDKYNQLKAKKRGSKFEIVLSELDDFEEQMSEQNVEDEVLTNELTQILNDYMKSLTNEKRTIFLDRYYQFYSIKQIAEYNRISESKVKIILMRLRNDLKEMLEKRWNV
ncbi:MAG: sigma-70 family RNA polymerase sigma factor [Clostridia bacterium]|nr:sigma-70 family RNA polymerase sigma factor [Clostridia bacterium]